MTDKQRGVSDTRDLARLDAVLYDRPAGRNIIGHAIDTIRALRSDNARLVEAERLIDELCGHEGAEGWSEALSRDLDTFYAQRPGEAK